MLVWASIFKIAVAEDEPFESTPSFYNGVYRKNTKDQFYSSALPIALLGQAYHWSKLYLFSNINWSRAWILAEIVRDKIDK